MLFIWPLMAAIQEISARIGRVTGDGIAGNIREHYPRPLLLAIVAMLLVANIINLGADLGAMGAALQLLLHGSARVYVVLFAVACALLEVFSRYEDYVRVLKWTAVSLFAYVAAALAVDLPWGKAVYTPSCRASSGAGLPRLDRRGARHDDHAPTAFSGSPRKRPRTNASTPRPTG